MKIENILMNDTVQKIQVLKIINLAQTYTHSYVTKKEKNHEDHLLSHLKPRSKDKHKCITCWAIIISILESK